MARVTAERQGGQLGVVPAMIAAFLRRLRAERPQAGAIMAMQTFGSGQRLSSVQRSSMLDPGSYRIQLRLAILALNSHGCTMARPYARRAAGMLPSAGAPRRLLERCGS